MGVAESERCFQRERETFFDWLEEAAIRTADRNVSLNDEHVLAIIDRARKRGAFLTDRKPPGDEFARRGRC